METSQISTPTPQVKFEASPAESFLSTPGELYPSLFASTPTATAMDPEGVMTPESYAGDDITGSNPDPSTPAAEGEKKPVKKRKSWGQVLPEPKTNLPPRKRAKTEDEKEQRRVERVLRNRRAAQSSRERKRLEVEALEQRNAALEAALREQQKQTMALMEELSKLRRNAGVVSRSPSPLHVFQPSPMTLSQPLFQESANGTAQPHSGIIDDLIMMPEQDGTVDPASISPELNPIADSDLKTTPTTTVAETEPVAAPSTAAASSDATQHPAAVLCDLQSTSDVADGLFGADFGLLPSSDTDHWGAQEQFSPSSDPLNFEYNHLDSDATPELPEFDINQFLSDDVSGAASGATAAHDSITQVPESTFSFFDFENQVPTETFNQQPQSGASTYGCDDGGLAVGV
ncbi:hypothetical protein FHL15_002574 [Xylaria flabelliformis]|uniref:BZIP domain-containing protein n=1 Tax=Xylaria flabelliformis TaxID=2512241 RepID=A0A553I7X4_9PEZI|nr:hypothetical protein FHL15_002574 [Xylaria flabelliformis]